jgi:hypothetical protein
VHVTWQPVLAGLRRTRIWHQQHVVFEPEHGVAAPALEKFRGTKARAVDAGIAFADLLQAVARAERVVLGERDSLVEVLRSTRRALRSSAGSAASSDSSRRCELERGVIGQDPRLCHFGEQAARRREVARPLLGELREERSHKTITADELQIHVLDIDVALQGEQRFLVADQAIAERALQMQAVASADLGDGRGCAAEQLAARHPSRALDAGEAGERGGVEAR